MTDQHLRDLLEQEAEAAPSITVAADTWARGRRRRRLVVGGRVAAAVVVLAAGLAIVPGLLDRDDDVAPAAPSDSLGVPDHLHAVPERMSDRDDDGSWLREEVTDDLATGTAAAAWVTDAGLPVVVDAATGGYHLLALPDVVSADREARAWRGSDALPLALSRDGDQLAYGYAEHVGDSVRTGLRVVDLTSGEVVRDLSLGLPDGVVVESVSWSPLDDFLAWTGTATTSWTATSIGGSAPVAGVVAVAGQHASMDTTEGASAVVSSEGALSVVESTRLRSVPGCQVDRARRQCFLSLGPPGDRAWSGRDLGLLAGAAALSPDGARVAVGTQGYDAVTVPLSGGRASIGPHGLPDDGPWTQRPVGWLGDRLLVQRDPGDGGDGVLSIVATDESGFDDDVVTVDPGVGRVSVALDLVGADQPTVSRPAPHWPWSEERWAATLGGGAALFVLFGAVTALLRNRRRG